MSKKTVQGGQKALSLLEKKLASSGLTLEDGAALGMVSLTATETAQLHPSFKSLVAMRINYLGPDGQPLSDWPKGEPFYRLRYLETATDFAALSDKKQPRYVQPPNTAPVAYFPQTFDDWPGLCADVNQPLIITEGELKAAKACKEGFPTVGLGGVYNWRSYKLGLNWLPSLDLVKWVRRNVYICFDSDYRTNDLVCHALRELADALQDHGAFVYLTSLPQLDGFDKVGLDDFLVASGKSGVEQFRDLLKHAEPLGLAKPLWAMNDRYVYIRNPGFIVDRTDLDNKVSPSAFKDHLEVTTSYAERQLKADGSISYKQVSAAAAWLKWPLRQEAAKLTYEPGKDRFIRNSPMLFNTWPGWGKQPKAGDVSPFLQLIDHLFTDAEPDAKQWFLRWCAYPLQYPGVKMFSSCVIHGVRHGTGKSLVGYTLGKIYGKNYTELSQLDIHNKFNEWAESKQFVMGDDVTGSNKRADADFLKKMITQRELRLNPKHIRSYVVPDCINYFFTSNQPDAFFLEDDDRRFFILEVFVGPLKEDFYAEYELWLDSGGAEAVFDYLLKLDLGAFNPAAPAFKTSAKARMIATGQSDLASWVRQLSSAPDSVLRVGHVLLDKDLFNAKELLGLYDPTGHTGTTANGLGRELARAGFRQVASGAPVRTSNGEQARYFAIRSPEYWLKQSTAKIIAHLDGDRKKRKK